jgi:hypothetical protein
MKTWVKGFLAAAVGGAATSVTHVLSSPGAVQPKQLGIGAGVGALVTVAAYLARSPIATDSTPPAKE